MLASFLWGMENYPSFFWGTFSRCHYTQYKDPVPIQPGFHRMSPAFFQCSIEGHWNQIQSALLNLWSGKMVRKRWRRWLFFVFFCEHFQCKDHPKEKNMSNKKDEEKQPFQPPTSQWLFVILEAVRSRYKLYFLDAFRPKAGIQRMLKMTCIYCIYIIARWQLDPSRIRKNERELVYQLQVFPGFK